jgi:hypothetical protein
MMQGKLEDFDNQIEENLGTITIHLYNPSYKKEKLGTPPTGSPK